MAKRQSRFRNNVFTGMVLIFGAVMGFVWWQPWEFDVVERRLPNPNPPVSPEPRMLFSPDASVVLITAHPDDAEFYLGGTLTKLHRAGAKVSLIVITDGDKGYYPFTDHRKNREIRRKEQTAAAKKWGVNEIVYLGYPDGRLRVSESLIGSLARNLKRLDPDYILSFDGEYPPRLSHGDHREAAKATDEAIELANVGRWVCRYSTIAPNYYIDVTDDWDKKLDLLAVHESQFKGESYDRIIRLLRDRAQEAGAKIGVKYAEPLRCELIQDADFSPRSAGLDFSGF